MTTFNTDYNNTELLDQELTDDQLELVAGGSVIMPPMLRLPGGIYNYYPKPDVNRAISI
ncbi:MULTISPECIES: hypothetical protein [unclassified Prochlorococcus]|uniref:hypothetical protein n=1 Tax=unclassified Prochlorococcus TaxID=2627481 RepID=UPI0005339D56|nr:MULTISPECIES: hypothetical protein [unclassified Prochlorococcus]KGG28519.1 hypothetical protein EV12_0606 [Prochlorococcus sp. MIT 0701]KGG28932.1 hypothetical protein EV13_1446 [Prochlorococcus sp. MIT 0702]KGG37136.1 hypothetical protein EV14_0078 [Prochlorococcus sp. MIT 0703]